MNEEINEVDWQIVFDSLVPPETELTAEEWKQVYIVAAKHIVALKSVIRALISGHEGHPSLPCPTCDEARHRGHEMLARYP